ncbi:single-stranded DNA-binding protein [Rhodococcus globerulus]|uniref:single-stranded DNA-binding protein n=1 Tax=Rhodococcus globerulus TaxID=33008 RepID=UPI00301A61EF
MALPTIDGTARIVGEPKLAFTPNGKAVLELTLVFNDRKFNRETQEWEDGDSWWANYAQLWGPKAEAAAEQLRDRGLVIVQGKIRTERWEDRQTQEKKSRDRLIIAEIGPVITASPQGGSPASSRQGGGNQRQGNDSWGSQQSSSGYQEPPF